VEDYFAGFCSDTLPTLLLSKSSSCNAEDAAALLSACKQELLLSATADGMVRAAGRVKEGTRAADEFAELAVAYLEAPKHSLQQFLAARLSPSALTPAVISATSATAAAAAATGLVRFVGITEGGVVGRPLTGLVGSEESLKVQLRWM
jgi:hypothetical protein